MPSGIYQHKKGYKLSDEARQKMHGHPQRNTGRTHFKPGVSPSPATVAHRDVPENSTDCPGTKFTPTIFEKFRTMVAEEFEK